MIAAESFTESYSGKDWCKKVARLAALDCYQMVMIMTTTNSSEKMKKLVLLIQVA